MIRGIVAGLLCLATTAAEAQIFIMEPVHRAGRGTWMVDVGGQMAQPIGDFRTNVDRAWGGGASVRHHFSWLRTLGLRGDMSFLNYGHERKRVPLSSTVNRVLVDMRTTNNIAVLSAGPEAMLMRGPVRPYAYGFVGYSWFYTESSAGGDHGDRTFARSTNFQDGGLATGWGGGLRIPFGSRNVSAALDVGARLTRSGVRSYLLPGDVIDQPDGSLTFNERRTTADFWSYHLGVSFSPRK